MCSDKNNSWLGLQKILNYVETRNISAKNWALICHSAMLWWLTGYILGKIICQSSNWQHIQSFEITILGANWQLFRLERIAKCSYFILSTQNIKFYWFVTKIKTFVLPIWWWNRGLFSLGNKYFGVFKFILNGVKALLNNVSTLKNVSELQGPACCQCISSFFERYILFPYFAAKSWITYRITQISYKNQRASKLW